MTLITKPLQTAGVEGIEMYSGDGVRRRCHPIFATYVGDYPEQCLVTGAYTGDCPICKCHHDELGAFPCDHEFRNLDEVFDALEQLGTPNYNKSCRDAKIKPIQHPFWENLPFVNIYQSITPDILHQLYQGVFKHLVSWLSKICGEAEIDARVRRLPPNHSIRIFQKGITTLSRVSGTEHRQMSCFILGLITDLRIPGHRGSSASLLRATRALLDFLYLAQYPVHTDDTLTALDTALADFHANKNIFVELGVRSNFNIPKLHSLLHYSRAIKLFGTTDNYSTESTERLHIDFAKEAYRATNHKDEFSQMTKWLERREKVLHHTNFILWRQRRANEPNLVISSPHLRWQPPDMACSLNIKMTRNPTYKLVPIKTIISDNHYGATFFIPALQRFIAQCHRPNLSPAQLDYHASGIDIPFTSVPVYHRIKFWNEELYGNETLDSIHVQPARRNDDKTVISPARFDTALVQVRNFEPENEGAVHHGGLRGNYIYFLRLGDS